MSVVRWSVLLLVVLSACSHSVTPRASTRPVATAGAVRYEKGIAVALPLRAKSSKDVSAISQIGQDLFITDSGFKPKSLITAAKATIYITNETSQTQTVKFTNWPWTSPPIAPGKTATYKPDSTVSISYELVSNTKFTGDIEIQPWQPDEGTGPPPTATP